MSLERLAVKRVPHLTGSSTGIRRELSGKRALAFVRPGSASWRSFRILERSALEGALALARQGRGQTLLVTLHGLRDFVDRRIDTLEVKASSSAPPFTLIRDLLSAVLGRSDSGSAASSLPAGLLSDLRTSSGSPDVNRLAWAEPIADFVASLSLRAPLMIVLDRIHHADADSLRVVSAIAERIAASPILLVATHRIDARPNPHLEATMSSLLSSGTAHGLVIASSQADETRLLFEAAFGRTARPETVAAGLSEDDAALLTRGLIAVAACRRAGRWPEAKTLCERLIEASERQQAPYVTHAASIGLGHVLADQGKWDECLQRLEGVQSAVEASKEDDLIAWLYLGLSRAYWAKTDRRRAFQMLRLAQTVAERTADASLKAAIALRGVEWLADNRRLRASREWLDSIEQVAEQTEGPAVGAKRALANGVVALAEGDPVSAAGFFRAALQRWTELRHDHATGQARLRLASALLARDNADSRRDGREELSEAHVIFSRLGAAADMETTEALGAKYGIRPRARRHIGNGSASPGGITPREREVLELLVKGMTNRQIAATLSITEKTAEGHVSNILAKLGVASRGQAAGYAVANGLLEAGEA